MSGKVDQYRATFVRALHLESLDDHESLTFLRRHLSIRPSQLLFYTLTFIAALLLVLDGCAIFASVACFLLPALRCIEEFLAADPDRNQAPEQPSSQYTDEEFSQIVSSSRARVEVAQVFTVYFSIYIITEILTPVFSWVVGSVVWLILRCLLAFVMVFNSKRERLALRVLEKLRPRQMGRRNAML